MLFTTHSIVGAAVGTATGNPVAGFLAGAVSHHVLDSILHFDQGSFRIQKSGAKYMGREAVLFSGYNEKFSKRDWVMLGVDFALAAILFVIIFSSLPESGWLLIMMGGLGGLAPDILDSSPLWSSKIREEISLVRIYHKFHTYFHWTASRSEILWGSLTQVILVIVAILYLLH